MIENVQLYFDADHAPVFSQVYGASYLKEEPLNCIQVEQGIIMPMTRSKANFHRYEYGVLDEDGRYIEASGKYLEAFSDHKLPPQIPYRDEVVVFGGYIPDHYGHFLLETTIRLWYFLEKRTQGQKLCFFTSLNDIPKFAKDFFELLEINQQDIILVRGYTRFQKVIIPEPSFVWWQYYTKEFLIPFRKAAKNVVAGNDERIYLSRRNCELTAKAFGEDDIEEVMNANGFKSVEFQFMSLREQISAIKGAKVIAGINGTAMHNVLFSTSKPEVVVFNRSETPDSQYIINDAAECSSIVVQTFNNPLRVIHGIGPFIVGATNEFIRFCKDRGMTCTAEPLKTDKWLPYFMLRYLQKYKPLAAFKLLVDEGKFTRETYDFIKSYRRSTCSRASLWSKRTAYLVMRGKLRSKLRRKYKVLKEARRATKFIIANYNAVFTDN